MPACNLLGWHGTVLRVDNATDEWFHALPWPDDGSGTDLAIDLPPDGLVHPRIVDWFVVEPASRPGCISLHKDGKYLSADPALPFVHFACALPGPLESFRPLSPGILARLRAVLAGRVRIAETGATEHAALADKFTLFVAGCEFPIWDAAAGPDGGLILRTADLQCTLVPLDLDPPPARHAIPLDRAHPPHAADPAGFAQGQSSTMRLAEAEEYVLPPITLSDADQIWMQQKPWSPDRQYFGRAQPRCEIARARDVFVLLSRGQEGTIFGQEGLYTDPIYLDTVPLYGTGFLQRHGRHVSLRQADLDAAPRLRGPHVVFYGGLISNYFHWLIEALVPLAILAPQLPPGTRLLLPGSLAPAAQPGGMAQAYQEMLDDWGFGAMPTDIVHAPVCRLDEVFWLRNLNLDSLPASCLARARDHALACVPAAHADAPRKRLYIRRTASRRVRNAADVEAAVTALGFTLHELAGIRPRDQMALFRQADMVIAPHGADLANLLYCAPGTKVIELSPDVQFRSFYGQISDKLRLSHAVLPCPAVDGHFDSDIHVDPARLTALCHLMRMRA